MGSEMCIRDRYEAIEFDGLDKLQNESNDNVGGLIQFVATMERDWILPS